MDTYTVQKKTTEQDKVKILKFFYGSYLFYDCKLK